jgi:hypothetical protein
MVWSCMPRTVICMTSFWQTVSNMRIDAWGARSRTARLILETVDAMAAAWSIERVGVRLGPSISGERSARHLQLRGARTRPQAHWLSDAARAQREGSRKGVAIEHVAKTFRPMTSAPLIADTRFDKAKGIDILRRGDADAIAYGPLYIANPDLVARLKADAPLSPIPLLSMRGSQGLHRLSGAVSKRQGCVAPPTTGPRAECSVREHGAMGSMALTRCAAATGRRGACCSPRRSAEQQCRTYR